MDRCSQAVETKSQVVRDTIRAVRRIGQEGSATEAVGEGLPPMRLVSRVVDGAETTGPTDLEAMTDLTLPRDVAELWQECSGLFLFQDVTYGQWGLHVFARSEAEAETDRARTTRPLDFLSSDLVLGEFVGDSELLVVRCDAASVDFGAIRVARPLDPRLEWPQVASSLSSFLRGYMDARGRKYWETHPL